MSHTPIPQWAKARKMSRRKAEYIAKNYPEYVVLKPKKIVRTVFVKCLDDSAPIELRGKDAESSL